MGRLRLYFYTGKLLFSLTRKLIKEMVCSHLIATGRFLASVLFTFVINKDESTNQIAFFSFTHKKTLHPLRLTLASVITREGSSSREGRYYIFKAV